MELGCHCIYITESIIRQHVWEDRVLDSLNVHLHQHSIWTGCCISNMLNHKLRLGDIDSSHLYFLGMCCLGIQHADRKSPVVIGMVIIVVKHEFVFSKGFPRATPDSSIESTIPLPLSGVCCRQFLVSLSMSWVWLECQHTDLLSILGSVRPEFIIKYIIIKVPRSV